MRGEVEVSVHVTQRVGPCYSCEVDRPVRRGFVHALSKPVRPVPTLVPGKAC